MPYSSAANPFRLFICHDADGLQLAVELRQQLLDYGISAFVAHETQSPSVNCGGRTQIQEALREMDGLVALVTRQFSANAWCNQELGFAMGKGVHIQCIELSGRPGGLAAASPLLSIPTDFDLALLIGRCIARDSLASERLRPAAIEAVFKRTASSIESGLGFLESIAWPGSGAADQLSRARVQIGDILRPESMRRLDRLIERWRELTEGDESKAKIRLAQPRERRSGRASRGYMPLVGPF